MPIKNLVQSMREEMRRTSPTPTPRTSSPSRATLTPFGVKGKKRTKPSRFTQPGYKVPITTKEAWIKTHPKIPFPAPIKKRKPIISDTPHFTQPGFVSSPGTTTKPIGKEGTTSTEWEKARRERTKTISGELLGRTGIPKTPPPKRELRPMLRKRR